MTLAAITPCHPQCTHREQVSCWKGQLGSLRISDCFLAACCALALCGFDGNSTWLSRTIEAYGRPAHQGSGGGPPGRSTDAWGHHTALHGNAPVAERPQRARGALVGGGPAVVDALEAARVHAVARGVCKGFQVGCVRYGT